MRRGFQLLGVLVRTALRGLQASPGTTAATVLTIGIALFVVGFFALLAVNMRGLLERVGEEIPVSAYFASAVDEESALGWVRQAESIDGVDSVVFVSSAAALERFRGSAGGEELLEGVEGNPLPASLEVSLGKGARDPGAVDRIARELEAFEAVDDVRYGGEWLEGYNRALQVVRAASWGLGTVLGLAALLIASNTIRLGIYAREDELEILALVGASRTVIRSPFLLEGLVQGMLGGVLALSLLGIGFLVFRVPLGGGFELLIGSAPPRFLGVGPSAALLGGGAALGGIGAVTALVGWRK